MFQTHNNYLLVNCWDVGCWHDSKTHTFMIMTRGKMHGMCVCVAKCMPCVTKCRVFWGNMCVSRKTHGRMHGICGTLNNNNNNNNNTNADIIISNMYIYIYIYIYVYTHTCTCIYEQGPLLYQQCLSRHRPEAGEFEREAPYSDDCPVGLGGCGALF